MTSGLPPVAVLLGGGVESTSLVRRFLAEGRPVVPVHVHCGLIWDDCESRYARRFCDAAATAILAPLVEIRLPLHNFLAGHWAATGDHVPRAGASSSDLEIPLRNLTLLSFALHRVKGQGISAVALGTTADNSYCDGSREYFDLCEQVLSLEAARPVTVLTPLIGMNKTEVIRSSDAATLALSFSCVNPRGDLHCGECIKCGKRKAAFRSAARLIRRSMPLDVHHYRWIATSSGIGTHHKWSQDQVFSLPTPREATEAAERARIEADGGSSPAKPTGGGECRLTLATPILTFPHQATLFTGRWERKLT